MPWMVRKSGKSYYYRKVREGSKVRSVYMSSDEAEAVARSDLERRNAIQIARRQLW